MRTLTLSPLLAHLRPVLHTSKIPVFLVGGAVRDALLGRTSHDLDFAVPERAIELAFRVADAMNWPAYVLDEERDVGRVVVGDYLVEGEGTTLDFTRFRGPDLEADLRGRDFTVNALALPLYAPRDAAGEIVDYFGGLDDLSARRLQIVHSTSLLEDPVRALRAVRLAEDLDFTLSAESVVAARKAAARLSESSSERVRDELLKMMSLSYPHRAVEQMIALELLAAVLPEIAALTGVTQSPPHHEDVLAHTISVMRWLIVVEGAVWSDHEAEESGWRQTMLAAITSHRQALHTHFNRRVDGGLDGRVLLRLGALFHDCGKKATRTIDAGGRIRFYDHEHVGANLAVTRLGALALSNEAIGHVRFLIENHMRPLQLAHANTPPRSSRRAIYRYFRASRSAGLDAALHALADHLAKHDGPGLEEEWRSLCAVVGELLASYFVAYEEVIVPPRLVDGKTLMDAFGLKPGPEIGRLLALIQEAQAAGEVVDTEGALAYARQQL